jgi:hypothetical protein
VTPRGAVTTRRYWLVFIVWVATLAALYVFQQVFS